MWEMLGERNLISSLENFLFFLLLFFKFYFIFKLYIIVLVLPNILETVNVYVTL